MSNNKKTTPPPNPKTEITKSKFYTIEFKGSVPKMENPPPPPPKIIKKNS